MRKSGNRNWLQIASTIPMSCRPKCRAILVVRSEILLHYAVVLEDHRSLLM